MRQVLILVFALLLTACGGGEATRWMSPESRTVTVENIPYKVFWIRDATGIDMHGGRDVTILVMPDELIERRRNTEAAVLVGTELCGGKATVVAEMKSGGQYATRLRCG
jgi:hypothetical protein